MTVLHFQLIALTILVPGCVGLFLYERKLSRQRLQRIDALIAKRRSSGGSGTTGTGSYDDGGAASIAAAGDGGASCSGGGGDCG